MPKEFESCVKRGGRVRSKRVDKNNYIKICFIGGKSYAGEKHRYKKFLKKK